MTRSERVRAACERFAEGPPVHLPGETVDEGIEAALDAALADLGGLDGLDALRADRDRLREAVRLALTFDPNPMGDGPHWSVVEDALRESEATHG